MRQTALALVYAGCVEAAVVSYGRFAISPQAWVKCFAVNSYVCRRDTYRFDFVLYFNLDHYLTEEGQTVLARHKVAVEVNLVCTEQNGLSSTYFAAVELDRVALFNSDLEFADEIREQIVACRRRVGLVQCVDAIAGSHTTCSETQVTAVVGRTLVECRCFNPGYTGAFARTKCRRCIERTGRTVAVARIVNTYSYSGSLSSNNTRRNPVAYCQTERAGRSVTAVVFSHVNNSVCTHREASSYTVTTEGVRSPQVVARESSQATANRVHTGLSTGLRVESSYHRADVVDA